LTDKPEKTCTASIFRRARNGSTQARASNRMTAAANCTHVKKPKSERREAAMKHLHVTRLVAFAALLALEVRPVSPISFSQTNLVSKIPGLAALTDPNLKNSWGVSFSTTSPIWISNQGTSTADLFTVKGLTVTQNTLEVSIPTTASGPQGPTGQVNNNTSGF